MKKRIIITLLCVALIFTAAPCASAAQTSIENSVQLADYSLLQRRNGHSPITITEATLHRSESDEDIYLILLDGLCPTLKNPNNLAAVLLSSMNLSTVYLRRLKAMVEENVPAGSKLVLYGYSLGGMIAQQLADDKDIKADYEIIHTITAGAPKVLTLTPEGGFSRLALIGDIVPYLPVFGVIFSSSVFSRESGDYGLLLYSAHSKGYSRSDIWEGYDCLGIKGGSSYITISPDAESFYSLYVE